MYTVTTTSSMFPRLTMTLPSFVRAVCAIKRVIEQREKDWGIYLRRDFFYEKKSTFVVEYVDDFDVRHVFYVKKIE